MRLAALKLRRRIAAWRTGEGPLGAVLGSRLPAGSTPFAGCEFLCLDIETTGVNARRAEMLGIGWVLIRRGRVEMASAESALVRPSGGVGESATVHGLTDTRVEAGEDVRAVLVRVLAMLAGRALVVHYAGLDKTLLDRLCRGLWNGPLLVPTVDTLELERRRRQRRHHVDEQASLRLADLRRAYNLPAYSQHHALADAIATAELLLAMVAARGGPGMVRLRDLLC